MIPFSSSSTFVVFDDCPQLWSGVSHQTDRPVDALERFLSAVHFQVAPDVLQPGDVLMLNARGLHPAYLPMLFACSDEAHEFEKQDNA